jgi:DNA-binding LytR/AlgR family response regulator
VSTSIDVLAVDDERPALDDLARLLRASAGVGRVDTADSGGDALRQLASHSYTALFLDVRMPELGGIELAAVLRRFAAPPAVVFVSAYEEAAVEAFAVRAVDYLLKPVSRGRLDEAIDRVRSVVREVASARPGESEVVPVSNLRGGGTRLVRRASILYLEAQGDYVRVVADDGRFLLRARLTDIEQRWEPFGFTRVHRRYLANLPRAVEVRPQLNGTAFLAFPDGSEVPVARRHSGELMRRLRA